MKPTNAQCPVCRHSFVLNIEPRDDYICPNEHCQTHLFPLVAKRKVAIAINWDDLVVLCWFAKAWADEKFPDTDERLALLNIFRELEDQRQGIISITNSPADFAPLVPKSPTMRAGVKKTAIDAIDTNVIGTINRILVGEDEEEDDDDEEEDTDQGGMGKKVRPKK